MSPVPQSSPPVPTRGAPRMARRFRPHLWSLVLTVVGCVVLGGLGVWQIDRGQQKAAYLEHRAQAMKKAPQALERLPDTALPATPEALRVVARGRYVPDKQLLFEGRSSGERSGYDVLTPFVLDDGAVVLVNRGWIPRRSEFGGGYAADLDVTNETREITGLWRALPVPGLRLDADNCRARPWPRYVSYPTDADLRCLYGATVRRGEIELDANAPDGFVRDWRQSVGFPPVRHYAYAMQWFMFAVIALYLFYRLNLRWVAAPGRATGDDATSGDDSTSPPSGLP